MKSNAGFAEVTNRILEKEEDQAREKYIKQHAPIAGFDKVANTDQELEAQSEGIARRAIASAEASWDTVRALKLWDKLSPRVLELKVSAKAAKDSEVKAWGLKMAVGFEAAQSSGDGQKEFDGARRLQQAEFLARWYNQCRGDSLDNVLEKIAAGIYGQDQDPRTYLAQTGAKERGFLWEELSRVVPLQSDAVTAWYPKLGRPQTEGPLAKAVLNEAKIVSVGSCKIANRATLISEQVIATIGRENAAGLKFDHNLRRWVATRELPEEVVVRANQVNAKVSAELTVPDNLITKNGKIVGFVEAKCWQEPELDDFVTLLASQTSSQELNARNLGGIMPNGLNLQLKLQNERDYVAAAAGLNSQGKKALLAVIRLPANLSTELIGRLHRELERRNERVVIERVDTLTADETEMVATSLIDLDFAAREQKRFAKEAGNDRNLKARAVALGVRLEELTRPQVTSILSESDVVLEDALAPENRSALVRQLAADYSANKKG